MAKCDCYYQHGTKFVCYGTKEMEECSCGGDESKCNFYPEKRKQKMANEKRLIRYDGLKQEIIDFKKGLNPKNTDYATGYFSALSVVEGMMVQHIAVDAVEVEKYKALLEMYHDLRENFIDYYCSGTQNVAPYCLNKCKECVDKWGYCKQYSDYCKGFNPAEVILDGAKMDGDGNG